MKHNAFIILVTQRHRDRDTECVLAAEQPCYALCEDVANKVRARTQGRNVPKNVYYLLSTKL